MELARGGLRGFQNRRGLRVLKAGREKQATCGEDGESKAECIGQCLADDEWFHCRNNSRIIAASREPTLGRR